MFHALKKIRQYVSKLTFSTKKQDFVDFLHGYGIEKELAHHLDIRRYEYKKQAQSRQKISQIRVSHKRKNTIICIQEWECMGELKKFSTELSSQSNKNYVQCHRLIQYLNLECDDTILKEFIFELRSILTSYESTPKTLMIADMLLIALYEQSNKKFVQ